MGVLLEHSFRVSIQFMERAQNKQDRAVLIAKYDALIDILVEQLIRDEESGSAASSREDAAGAAPVSRTALAP